MTSTVVEPLERADGPNAPLLDVRDLRTFFKTDDGTVRAVDGVSFTVEPGKTLGVVGESGSGKSVTMMSILNLNPKPGRLTLQEGQPPGPQMEAFLRASKKHTSISTGQALFRGENLLLASKRRLRALRGSEISMIFQDPMTSLNPVLSIGNQLVEAIVLHRDVTSKQARELAIAGLQEVGIPRPERRIDDYPHQFSGGMRQRVMIAMALINDPALLIADEPTTALDVTTKRARALAIEGLREVGIPRAEQRIDDYPHQFSGGMRQRVMIAMALINDPALLIADEPTTALDVTTQAQILGLIQQLQADHGTAVVLITHDLGVVAETADDIVVMYAARIAEQAPVYSLFEQPRHPYTWGLLGSLPRLDVELERLSQIRGQPPSLLRPPTGCRFRPRCTYAFDRCRGELPEATPATFDPEHLDACFLPEERKRQESARVVRELGLDEEAA